MNEPKTELHTGIYIRVSTEEQVQEGFSIRAQMEKLKSYALLKDWEIYDIYADEGISGKNIVDRPAINRLINDIKDGNVNNVLVFKVDRLTRSTKNLIELVDLFDKNDCAFNSLTESIDTDTPSGRMFLKIIGIFAEFERENLISRMKVGYERKVKEGYTLATHSISYGYHREKGQRIQKIISDEARIVKEIFSMYIDENKSMGKIAKILNERKIPTKSNGTTWSPSSIKRILTNPTYIGKVRYATTDKNRYFEAEGQHEALISNEIFYLAQEKAKNTSNISSTKRPKEDNYFCGILVCGQCGGKFTTHHNSYKLSGSEEKLYKSGYRCNNKKYYNNTIACKSPAISHPKMEQAFVEYINKINDITATEDVEIKDDNTEKERELQKYIFDCEKNLNIFKTTKKKIMEQYVNQEISFEEYKNLLSIANEKYQALEKELQRAKAEMPTLKKVPNISHEDIILSFKENWSYLNNNEKAMFLQTFVKKIVINIEKERRNSNMVTIMELEFNLSSEFTLIDNKKSVKNKLYTIKHNK